MKVKTLKTQNTAGTKTMPADLRDKLNGLTINEALERGIINDLGDDKGQFVFDHADSAVDASYAVVQGYAVRCSDGLKAGVDGIDDVIGDLRFSKGISTVAGDGFGKEWFRLGMPAGIRLGASIKSLAEENVVV